MAALVQQEQGLGAAALSAAPRRAAFLLPLLPALLLPALLLRGAGAQEPAPPAGPTLAEQLRALRAPDLDAAARSELAAAIAARGPDAALPLLRAVTEEQAGRRRTFERTVAAHLRAAGRSAALAARRLRGPQPEIDGLQQQARAITRSDDLDRERIRAELDPILAELQRRTVPSFEQVLALDPELADAHAAVRRAAADLGDWFALYLRCMHAADATGAGRTHLDRTGQVGDPPDPALVLDRPLATLVLVAASTGRDSRLLQRNAALADQLDPEEFDGLLQLNRIRLALGRPVLAIDLRLCAAARGHSEDMRALGFFSHESPVPGRRTFGDRAAAAGTSASAENIAAGHERGASAIRAWWYSPGHHRNMLGDHGRVGLGRAGGLWTQLFGG